LEDHVPQEQDFPNVNHLCLQALAEAVQLQAAGSPVVPPLEEQQLG